MAWVFRNGDYVHQFKKERKPRKEKQAKIPKPPPDYNGSKSVDIKINRKDVRSMMRKATDLK